MRVQRTAPAAKAMVKSASRAHGAVRTRTAEPNPSRPLHSLVGNYEFARRMTPVRAPRVQRLCDTCEDEESRRTRAPQIQRLALAGVELGAPDDVFEREANRVADRIVGGPAERRAAAPADSMPPQQELSRSQLTSGGSALPEPTRRFFEQRMNHRFGGVRVHSGPGAAAVARALKASAFTYTNHVWVSSPRMIGRTRIMAHELAHVVQQGGAPPLRSDAGTRSEQPGRPASIQRFASDEHVRLGNEAIGRDVLIAGYGPLSFGELTAIAGDYFESLRQIEALLRQNRQFAIEQIDAARMEVNPSYVPSTPPSQAARSAVLERYQRLAARNETHFSVGPRGRTNRDQYVAFHRFAIRAAYYSFMPDAVPGYAEALEGFAGHFLSDAFSAGHVRTPRHDLRVHWNALYPHFADNLLRLLSCYMSAYIAAVDRPLIPRGLVQGGVPFVAEGVEAVLRRRAASTLGLYGIGDLLALAMHDADSRGLDVVSGVGPSEPGLRWRAVGDTYLYPSARPRTREDTERQLAAAETRRMAETALRLSYAEVQRAYPGRRGSRPLSELTDPRDFAALELIPQAAAGLWPTSTWHVGSIRALPRELRDALDAEFHPGGVLHEELASISVDRCTAGVRSGAAWRCLVSVLTGPNPFELIARACEGRTDCPSGNPCPSQPTDPICS